MHKAIIKTIEPRKRDLGGGFTVRRVLPFHSQKTVGPFIFFDHFGPVDYAPNTGFDVRSHPHIGLATVTYLFEGAIRHRDSLGTDIVIRPGAVNWMTAGHGIVHSERTPDAERAAGQSMHGLQTWVALPQTHEDTAPAFVHHPADTLPEFTLGGANLRVLAGAAWGHHSPVDFPWPILYVAIETTEDAKLVIPASLAEEKALYVVSGTIKIENTDISDSMMAVLDPDTDVSIYLAPGTKAVICGGAALEAPRKLEWNFVASEQSHIDIAKQDWMDAISAGGSERFPKVPGDEDEWIPLPD